MTKRPKVLVPVLLIAAAVAWLLARGRAPEDDGLGASGTVEATDADLGFQAAGRVSSVEVVEGATVAEGDTLAFLDTRELEAQLEAARAQREAEEARLAELEAGARTQEIAAAEAAVRSAESRAGTAGGDAERARMLFDGGAVSRQALDRAQSEHELALAALEQAREHLALTREGPRPEALRAQRAQVAQAAAEVARAEATLANTVIVASFPGIVTRRHREPGESVTPGAPVLTLLDPTDRWVRIYVREDRIGQVRLGAPASIRSDSHPGRAYEGKVVFIGAQAEFTPRNVQTTEERTRLVYPVKVRISGDPEVHLKPGVPADVHIEVGGR